MGNLLEQSGINVVAEGARKFIEDVRQSGDALRRFTEETKKIGAADATGNAFKFGEAIGVSLSAGATAAAAAVGVLTGAVAAAASIMAFATGKALEYGSAIDRIQAVTSLSAGAAQKLYAGARIAGVGVEAITNGFGLLANRLDQAKDVADDAFGSMSGGADRAAIALQRLNDDHARTLVDTLRNLAESQAAQAAQAEQANEDYYRVMSRMEEDYERETTRGREDMQRQLSDMAENHMESQAKLAQDLADLQSGYDETRLQNEADLEQSIADMREAAQSKITDIQTRGNDEQTRLASDLAAELAAIDQKYAQKRESLMERIADPSTNPILRAYLRSQLNSLGGQQSSEASAANARYQAERQRLQDKTNFEIAEVRRKLEETEALERAKAARDAAARAADYARKLADLQASIAKEQAEYDRALARQLQANALRIEDARRSHDRQYEDTVRANNRRLEQERQTSARLAIETQNRIDQENRQYERALEDMASSAGGAASKVTPLSLAFQKLGLDMKEFQKLGADKQFDVLRKAIEGLGEGEAFTILSDLFGPSRADEIMDFFDALKLADTVDAPFTEQDVKDMEETQRQFNLIKLQADLLWAKVGRDLLPIIKELLAQFQKFWQEHGPEVIAALKEFTTKTVPEVVAAIKDISKWIDQAIKDVSAWVKQAGIDIKRVNDDVTAWFNDLGRKVDRIVDNYKWAFEQMQGVAERWVEGVRRWLGYFETIRDAIGRILGEIGTFFLQNTLVGKLWEIAGGVDGIKRALEFARDRFRDLANMLQGLQLPWWLTPGSPTPLEWGIRGVTDALKGLGAMTPEINLAGRTQSAVNGGSRYVAPASAASIYQNAKTTNMTSTTTVNMPVTFNGGVSTGAEGRVIDTLSRQLARAGVMVTR